MKGEFKLMVVGRNLSVALQAIYAKELKDTKLEQGLAAQNFSRQISKSVLQKYKM